LASASRAAIVCPEFFGSDGAAIPVSAVKAFNTAPQFAHWLGELYETTMPFPAPACDSVFPVAQRGIAMIKTRAKTHKYLLFIIFSFFFEQKTLHVYFGVVRMETYNKNIFLLLIIYSISLNCQSIYCIDHKFAVFYRTRSFVLDNFSKNDIQTEIIQSGYGKELHIRELTSK